MRENGWGSRDAVRAFRRNRALDGGRLTGLALGSSGNSKYQIADSKGNPREPNAVCEDDLVVGIWYLLVRTRLRRVRSHHAWRQTQSCSHLAHFRLCHGFAFFDGLFDPAEDQVFENFDVFGIDNLFGDFDSKNIP